MQQVTRRKIPGLRDTVIYFSARAMPTDRHNAILAAVAISVETAKRNIVTCINDAS